MLLLRPCDRNRTAVYSLPDLEIEKKYSHSFSFSLPLCFLRFFLFFVRSYFLPFFICSFFSSFHFCLPRILSISFIYSSLCSFIVSFSFVYSFLYSFLVRLFILQQALLGVYSISETKYCTYSLVYIMHSFVSLPG